MSPSSSVLPPPVTRRIMGFDQNDSSAEGPAAKVTFRPPPPTSLADAGVTDSMVDAIVFKFLLGVGSASGCGSGRGSGAGLGLSIFLGNGFSTLVFGLGLGGGGSICGGGGAGATAAGAGGATISEASMIKGSFRGRATGLAW